MSQLENIPRQSYFSEVLQSPINSTQTTGIILSAVPDYTPSNGETLRFNILDPDSPETIEATGWNIATNELSGVTRGVDTYTGEGASGSPHSSGIKVVLSNDWNVFEDIRTAVNSKADTDSPSFTTDIQVPVYANAAARDAGIPAPANGMMVYNTADGLFQVYQAGAWADLDTGAAQPNATETVAGKVELATDAELAAGTDTGGTGSSLVAIPSQIAESFQNNNFTYATTGGVADAYTLTVTPAINALAAGQVVIGKIHAVNTGASTINVSGLGVKTIKKANDQDLEAGDLEVNQIVILGYDGTNFQLLSPVATQMTTANAATLTDSSDADSLHRHSGTGNSYFTYILDTNSNFWTTVAGTPTYSANKVSLSGTANEAISTRLEGPDDNGGRDWEDSEKIIVEYQLYNQTITNGEECGSGLVSNSASVNASDTQRQIIVQILDSGSGDEMWFRVADGAAATTNQLAGVTLGRWNTIRIEYDPGVDAKVYVNNVLKDTITTNLPGGANDINFAAGIGSTVGDFIALSPVRISTEIT